MLRSRMIALLVFVVFIVMVIVFIPSQRGSSVIRVGALFSLTGAMASNEAPLADVIRLAVEEINAAGGLTGRDIDLVVADGRSDDEVFAREAERLINEEKISVLIACWTSNCRKAIAPVVEKNNNLMIYPLQYEGFEKSPNILYAGLIPNQQIIPGVRWAMETFGKRVILLGSANVFSGTANIIIRDLVQLGGGAVLAERYPSLGNREFSAITHEIKMMNPDVVINTFSGDSSRHFIKALHNAGLSSLPVISFSLTEEVVGAGASGTYHPNSYAVWNYFQSIDNENNKHFVASYKRMFGTERVTNDPIESAYSAVYLWAQAVRDANKEEPELIRQVILQQSVAAPSGVVAVDRNPRPLLKQTLVGKAREDGQFDIVWSSGEALRPTPFPSYRTVSEWQKLLTGMR